jgi:pimeloyl-ACP methyl ester carboxylesterase|tara:strand:+ start:777 stop:1892 length:1116 start_codon:yes stop_codon:yes gene_type:complete
VSVEREFVGLPSPVVGRAGAGGHPCQGVYYRPRGSRPTVAIIATHYNIDFSEHYLADLCATRGIGFLGWNTRFRGAEPYFLLDHAVAEIAVGIQWLRERAGIETVVLLGNSGGGSLMAAYQSQSVHPSLEAEYGRASIIPAAMELPSADLYISLAAHPGRPEVLTNWMDPSVENEDDPLSIHIDLDPYATDREIPFTPEFVDTYRHAQRDRNHRITEWARNEIDRVVAAGNYDRLFTTPRLWADLRMIDGSIDPSNRESPSCYLGDPRRANYGIYGVGTVSSLRTWLSMWSLSDSQCNAAPHLERIKIPALVVDADADTGVFPGDTQAIVDAIGSEDLTVTTLEGDHYLRDREDARDDAADLIAEWVKERS